MNSLDAFLVELMISGVFLVFWVLVLEINKADDKDKDDKEE